MAAKIVEIADVASGSLFNTLPGNTADLNRDGTQIDDTIFGQIFTSSQPGLINWGVTANALYRGFAGYVADIRRSGASTSFTAEAMTLVSGNTYKMTDVTKNLWDRNVALVFHDGTSGGPVIPEANVQEVNHLLGQVTFAGAETAPITVDGSFLPLTTFAKANAFTLTQTADTIDVTAFEDAQANSGFNLFEQTLLTASLELSGFYRVANNFNQLLIDRAELVIELNPDGSQLSFARGFFKAVTDNQTGDNAGTETETVTFNLTVPEGDKFAAPFQWSHDPTSTLSVAIQELLDSWAAQQEVQIQYLPDGVAGFAGNGIVTDISLTGGVDVMNEFSVSLQGTGPIAVFP